MMIDVQGVPILTHDEFIALASGIPDDYEGSGVLQRLVAGESFHPSTVFAAFNVGLRPSVDTQEAEEIIDLVLQRLEKGFPDLKFRERQRPDPGEDERLVEFASALPPVLEDMINRVHDWWEGEPLMIVARFGDVDPDAYVLDAEPGDRQLETILEALRANNAMPAAAALVFSSPLITPRGSDPRTAMLSTFCAVGGDGQMWRFWKLEMDDNDKARVGELPPDVVGEGMPSTITRFLVDVLDRCARVQASEENLDPAELDPVLEWAKKDLRRQQ